MNRIKTYLNGLGRMTRTVLLVLAVIFVSAGIAQATAVTTISTSITTTGTLTVSDQTLLGQATSTMLSAYSAYFGGAGGGATSTFATNGSLTLGGALSGTSGTFSTTLGVTGLASLLGGATTTQITLGKSDTIKNTAASTTVISGNLQTTGGFIGTTATLSGLASTSALLVGDETAAPTINGMVFGYCSFTDVTLAASSTNGFANCTTVPAGSLVAGDRVFVQATSSLKSQYIITAASTTGASTIQLRFLNTGLGTADGTLSGTSVNFWALR